MVARRLSSLGFPTRFGSCHGDKHKHSPSNARTMINGGDAGGDKEDNASTANTNTNTNTNNSVGVEIETDRSSSRWEQEGTAGPGWSKGGTNEGSEQGQLLSSSGGVGGGGDPERRRTYSPTKGGGGGGVRAEALAQSCLALSVARQADLWPLLRGLSEKNQKTRGSESETAAAAGLPVLYVAGELDGRYGGRLGCDLSAPVPAVSAEVKAAAATAAEPLPSREVVGASGVVRSSVGGMLDKGSGVSGSKAGGRRCNGSLVNGSGRGSSIRSNGNNPDSTGSQAAAAAGANCASFSASASASASDKGTKSVADVVGATCPEVGVAVLAGCGHAVPTEAPAALFRQVAKLSAAATAAAPAGTAAAVTTSAATPNALSSDSRTAPVDEAGGARIVGFSLEEFCIPMTAPLQLSLCRLTERRGVLVRLEGALPLPPRPAGADAEARGARGQGSQEEGRRVWGVGEVTPLPGECLYGIFFRPASVFFATPRSACYSFVHHVRLVSPNPLLTPGLPSIWICFGGVGVCKGRLAYLSFCHTRCCVPIVAYHVHQTNAASLRELHAHPGVCVALVAPPPPSPLNLRKKTWLESRRNAA